MLDSEVSWTRPEGGLFVWMTVPEGLDTGFDGPLFSRCVREGVLYVPGEFAFAAEPCRGRGITSASRSEYPARPSWSREPDAWRRR